MRKPLECVVSISGLRGIVGETIDAETVLQLAQAFASTLPLVKSGSKTIVLGRDSRPTGPSLSHAVVAGLQSVGYDVVDIGVVPTPTVPIMVKQLKAAGGIQISASHNPVEWNALKFFNKRGRNIDDKELKRLVAAYEQESAVAVPWNEMGGYRTNDDALTIHANRVLDCVDVDSIRAAQLKVVMDSVNGSGSVIAPRLLTDLNCTVVPLYANPDRLFPRDPEPSPANVKETGAVVKAVGADIGFVQDPDADRLAVIDEKGRYIGEEYTLVLCAAARLRAAKAAGEKNPLACTNLSTSRMLEDAAAAIGARVLRSSVGEANVVDAMQKHKAVIGGEGNGGVIDPRVVWGRDSQIGIALILELLAASGQSLSQLLAEIPSYAIHKEKVSLDRAGVTAAIPDIRSFVWAPDLAKGATVDEQDGVKIMWEDRWVHLRASGTEPASRIISEAPTMKDAKNLANRLRKHLGVSVITGH